MLAGPARGRHDALSRIRGCVGDPIGRALARIPWRVQAELRSPPQHIVGSRRPFLSDEIFDFCPTRYSTRAAFAVDDGVDFRAPPPRLTPIA